MKKYRVRKAYAMKGYPNYVYHATVKAYSEWQAIIIAMESRVELKWECIDSYDISTKTYLHFEVIGEVLDMRNE